MGKATKKTQRSAAPADGLVKKTIGKAKKQLAANASDKLEEAAAGVPQVGAASAADKKRANLSKLRRDAVKKATKKAARRQAEDDEADDSTMVQQAADKARAAQLFGPKPKMTGARMISEIEEAREFAEKDGDELRAGKKRPKRPSKHSRSVLAAFRAPSQAPELPSAFLRKS
eukprot:TRINITY_DN19982_c0_g1_i2.p1 TRINITY_DN19982_c0_g1~~TRINITY_DN19982_c0_g1_i2.p1  ORF type:complete len:173 (-),score=58.86 TRINITY_DN19982_c0_g1_i2:23-541(-)